MSLAWFLPLPGSYAGVDVVGVYNFACSLREVLAKHPFLPHGCGLFSGSYFPSFSEGLSLRERYKDFLLVFLANFPSFSEGLSLRAVEQNRKSRQRNFPSFSEGLSLRVRKANHRQTGKRFPFLFGGTFIEGLSPYHHRFYRRAISLPFRRDFH